MFCHYHLYLKGVLQKTSDNAFGFHRFILFEVSDLFSAFYMLSFPSHYTITFHVILFVIELDVK